MSATRNEEQMLKPEDVAEHLNVSERHIRRLCERGELPAIKVGRAWRIEPNYKRVLQQTQQQSAVTEALR